MKEAYCIAGAIMIISVPDTAVSLFHSDRKYVRVDNDITNGVEEIAALILVKQVVRIPVECVVEQRRLSRRTHDLLLVLCSHSCG